MDCHYRVGGWADESQMYGTRDSGARASQSDSAIGSDWERDSVFVMSAYGGSKTDGLIRPFPSAVRTIPE